MKYTTNYNLKKPEGTDTVNIDDLNDNADILDNNINSIREQINNLETNKADLVNGKVPSNQLPNLEVPVTSVNNKTGAVILTKSDVGLGSVDNTTDSTKAVLSATKLATPRTINGVNFDGTVPITIADGTKAPTNHQSVSNGYGLGTVDYYGHCRVINNLAHGTYSDGLALSAHQGYLLNEKNKYKVVELTSSGSWVVPDGVYEIDLILVGGGGGGEGGGSSSNHLYDGSSRGYTGGGGARGGNGNVKNILKVKVTPGTVIPYIVGAAGAGGVAGIEQGTTVYGGSNPIPATSLGGNGTKGGDTSILGFVAIGGTGGTSDNNEYQTTYGYPEILVNARPLSTGSNGTNGGIYFTNSPSNNNESLIPTVISGGGNGGRGGLGSLRAASPASNAIGYGSGGGGGGGGGGDSNNYGGYGSGFLFVQSGAAGGYGKQGIILIGYF